MLFTIGFTVIGTLLFTRAATHLYVKNRLSYQIRQVLFLLNTQPTIWEYYAPPADGYCGSLRHSAANTTIITNPSDGSAEYILMPLRYNPTWFERHIITKAIRNMYGTLIASKGIEQVLLLSSD